MRGNILRQIGKYSTIMKQNTSECFPNQYIPMPEPLSDIEMSKTDPAQEKQKWFEKWFYNILTIFQT